MIIFHFFGKVLVMGEFIYKNNVEQNFSVELIEDTILISNMYRKKINSEK